jgi:glycerophosphoryl diester phosphodiesterase
VDDPALARKLWQRGANGIVTNDPGAMAKVRSSPQQA